MSIKIVLLFISFFVLAAATQPAAAAEEATQEAGWEFGAEVYLWGSSIGGKTGSGSDIDIDFSSLFDDLEMAFMGLFGARKGKWSLLSDVIYLDVEDKNGSGNVNVPVGPLGGSTVKVNVGADVTVTGWIVTPAVGYNVIETKKGRLDVLAGARYLYLKSDAKLNITEELDIELRNKGITGLRQINDRIIDKGHVWDGIVGVRGHLNLNEKWYLTGHADVGTGDSDLTWQVLAGGGYRFSKFDVILAYRYMEWDFDDSEAFEDLDLSGPYLGVKYIF
jgi:hypothetical protein